MSDMGSQTTLLNHLRLNVALSCPLWPVCDEQEHHWRAAFKEASNRWSLLLGRSAGASSAARGGRENLPALLESRPKDNINIRISHSGSRAQYKEDTRNHGW